jgi:hypothetical protein
MAGRKGTPTGRCQGCNHPERVRIERFLAAGASIKGAPPDIVYGSGTAAPELMLTFSKSDLRRGIRRFAEGQQERDDNSAAKHHEPKPNCVRWMGRPTAVPCQFGSDI